MPDAPDNSSPSVYASDLPSVDPERMEMLRELCQDADPDMLREMLASWATEAARHLDEARIAMANSDHATFKAAAHAIKGSCSNMGIVRLSELGRLLEHQSAAPAIAAAIVEEMTTEFHRTQRLLAEIVAQS